MSNGLDPDHGRCPVGPDLGKLFAKVIMFNTHNIISA